MKATAQAEAFAASGWSVGESNRVTPQPSSYEIGMRKPQEAVFLLALEGAFQVKSPSAKAEVYRWHKNCY
jgi:hypothetical protein